MPRHFVDLLDLTPDEARTLIDRAIQLKRDERRGDRPPLLSGRTLGLIFEKPSLRTRVSFEAAIARLGGNAIFLRGEDVGLGTRESVVDFASVISQYVDGLAVRTFSHATIEELASAAADPDHQRPLRRLASLPGDGRLHDDRGAQGLARAAGSSSSSATATTSPARSRWPRPCSGPISCSAPRRLRVPRRIPGTDSPTDSRRSRSGSSATRARRSRAPTSSTPTSGPAWARSTRPSAAARRSPATRSTRTCSSLARDDVIFLHCLPAHREEEVTSEVLDGPHSQVLLQAANRLHFQMALLVWLLGDDPA